MGITYGDYLIDSGAHDITPEQEREIEAREECVRRGLDPDDYAADGVLVWMVVGRNLFHAAGYIQRAGEGVMAIQHCDNCNQFRPGASGESCGIEGFFCHICRGDELDPYGELDEVWEDCPYCNGEGGYDCGSDNINCQWRTCRNCDGSKGKFVEPDLDGIDLDERCGTGADGHVKF